MKRLWLTPAPTGSSSLCVVLLAIAVIDLARPYLIKVAIDNHILGFGQGRKREELVQNNSKPSVTGILGPSSLGWILFAIMTAGFVLNYVQVYLCSSQASDRLRHPPAHLRPYARLGLSLLTAIQWGGW